LCISFAFSAFGGCGLLYQIGLIDFGNRTDRFVETGLTGLCPVLALIQGEYAFVQGELLHALVVCSFVVSLFCLSCVEPLPLPKGTKTFLFQAILLFAFLWLSIAC
jgi:hypothetical protein